MHRQGLAAALAALTTCLAFALPAEARPVHRPAAPAPAAHPAPASSTARVPPIQFHQRVLPNGLHVLTSLDRTTPNVTVQVWYGVGARNDPQGRSGFAHLFEHLMFKSTHNMPAENMDRLTEDVGGFNNASTWDDFTNYYEVIPANHLERLLWAESDRMSSLVVDDANFHSERDVVKEELRLRVLAEPYGRLWNNIISEASWQTHPYHRAVIGSIEELDQATLDDVRTFHATYYRPDNAVLIIVGNYNEAQLNRWIDHYFAPITHPAAPTPRVTAVEPPRTGPRTLTYYAPNVPLPAVVVDWQIPPASHPDAAPLDVLDAILSAGHSSRLYNSLVYDRQIASEIYSDADLRNQPGIFVVGAVMASGQTVQTGEDALRAQIAAIRNTGVTQAELDEAKNELVAAAVRERETIDGRADVLGQAYMEQGDPARANSRIAALQAVTLADIQRVARAYLQDDRRVVIHYQNETDRPAGEAAQAPTPPPAVASQPYTGPLATLAPEGQRQAPPPVAAPVNATLPHPVERTLPNGLRVIVAQSTVLPLVTAQLTFHTGASADPSDLAGAVNMAAVLATQGTTTRSAQQIASQTEALGATLTSGSGFEGSQVVLNVLSTKLPQGLPIMADVVQNPVYAEDELNRVRSETLDALSVALQSPGQIAGFAANPLLYGGTAYGHVAGGTPTSLPHITRGDLRAIHDRYWRPDNATLVLAGNITPEAGFAMAEQAFGHWPRPASPLPPLPAAPASSPPRAIAIDLPGAGQAAVALVGPAIARNDPRYYAGLVATTVLGGGYSARLNYEIRIRRGLSYGASADLTARHAIGSYSAAAQTRNDAAPQVVGLVQTELGRMYSAAPDAHELEVRRASLIGDFGRNIGSTSSFAEMLSTLALYGVNIDEIQVYQQHVEAVTPAQVRGYAHDVLDPAHASIIVVGDGHLFLDALRQAVPTLEVIPAAQLNLDDPSLRGPAPPAPAPAPATPAAPPGH